MKCSTCKEFKDDYCQLVVDGKIGEIEDTSCLLRMVIAGINDLYDIFYSEHEDGEDWKK